ncbi:MAG: PLP-dependent lyase/thiolase [Pseudobdellovibrio sp.]
MIATTLVRLADKRLKTPHRLWTTLEGENPSGSIKDRIVEPELSIEPAPLQISEISAGSTAISLSYFAQKMNIQCHFFVPNTIDQSIKNRLIRSGAILTLCDPNNAYELYDRFCEENVGKIKPFHQMKRKELRAHYSHWAAEQIAPLLKTVDYVVGAVGTGHSLLGVTAGLSPKYGCLAVEPAEGQRVNGVRNLRLLHFGESDTCEKSRIQHRLEASINEEFSDSVLGTDHGRIYIGDSFKLSLTGAMEYFKAVPGSKDIFLVGSGCRRIA